MWPFATLFWFVGTLQFGFRIVDQLFWEVKELEHEWHYYFSYMGLFFLGTHYFRGINNLQQPWNSWTGRKKHKLKPNNPTEEGLASLHSVLFRKDPFLWRAALLYYTVYQASQMSFCELFEDIGKFVKDPSTRWDYCVRAKRGWTDTSQPGECPLAEGPLTSWPGV